MNLKQYIPEIPNFPKDGITFLDITTILETPLVFEFCINELSVMARGASSIVAIESRGFPFGACVAQNLGKPLVVARKPGKLPGDVYTKRYITEYSTDSIEIKTTSPVGPTPFIIDDLLATGGTILAVADILRDNFKIRDISAATVVNLKFLPGQQNLERAKISYDPLVEYTK